MKVADRVGARPDGHRGSGGVREIELSQAQKRTGMDFEPVLNNTGRLPPRQKKAVA